MGYDVDKALERLRDDEKRVLFYPSSASDVRWPFLTPNDVIVMAEHLENGRGDTAKARRQRFWGEVARRLPREMEMVASTATCRVFRVGQRWGFYFLQENNIVLDRLRRAGVQVHTFVGKNDGCREGGNHECVNDAPFFSKVLNRAGRRLVYMTDHYPEGVHSEAGERGQGLLFEYELERRRELARNQPPVWESPWTDAAPRRLFGSSEWTCQYEGEDSLGMGRRWGLRRYMIRRGEE